MARVEAYPSGASYATQLLGKSDSDKRTSLLQYGMNYSKRFIAHAPRKQRSAVFHENSDINL